LARHRRSKDREDSLRSRGQKIELNVFRGNLQGLVLAEVEFGSTAKSAEFKPPDWLGEEVTEDIRYKNQSLAQKGAPDG
jgi:adenylate cyclase